MADPVEVPAGPLVALDLAKQHLGVWSDETDALITLYINAASDRIRTRHVFGDPVPANVQAATLLMVEDLYDPPEASAAEQRLKTIDNLLRPFETPEV